MKSRIQFYSVYDALNFVVIDRKGFINRLFNNFDRHYENFKSNGDLEDCDLVIEIGEFTPQLDNSFNVGDGKYYFKENYLYVSKEQYKGAKWKFEINGLNTQKTVAKIDCNSLGRIFITGNVIDFLIHQKLLQKGYCIIHASAVSKNNEAVIFSSRGGGGKTTIALEMAENGFSFIGDNYVILHEGNILSFPTSLSIFSYNLAPVVYKNLYFKEKCEINIKKIVYTLTGGYAKFFTKVNPKRIFKNFASLSRLGSALLIIPKLDSFNKDPKLKEVIFEEFIEQLKYNFMLEFPFFNRYIEEYSYFFPHNDFSLHWDIYQKSLLDNFPKNISVFKIIVPTVYNKQFLSSITNLVDSD